MPHLLRTVIAGLAIGSLTLAPVQAATGNLIGTGGAARGTITVTAAPKGVILRVEATGLSPGWHGAHFHEKGDCSDPKFTSAGAHVHSATPVTHGQKGTVSSSSVVGSAATRTLAVKVTPHGVVLAKKRLAAGRYAVTVEGGKLVVTTPTHKRLTLAARKTTLTLTAGRWRFGATVVTVT